MKQRVAYLALVFGLAGAVSFGCSDDDTVTPGHGGAAGAAGKAGSAGKGGSGGNGGSVHEAGSAGETSAAGSEQQGGAAGAAGEPIGPAGAGGEGGEGGAPPKYTAEQIERGKVIVRSTAVCGTCHTTGGATPGLELGGNSAFAGSLGAPNLTDDPSGIGDFSDEQVIHSFRTGLALRKTSAGDDRPLSPVMPYWLFHNMSDADAQSVVAFLRSLPHATFTVVTDKTPVATAVTPLDPSAFPISARVPADADYAAAQRGKYLVSGVALCVKCHSPASGGLPIADFFSGNPPAATPTTTQFSPNITPDATGIATWTAADVATALKVGTNKAGKTLCGSMPSAAKGFGGLSDSDAYAIGAYLVSIPAVAKTAPAQLACP